MALLLKIDQHLNRIVHLFLILYKMRTLFFFFFLEYKIMKSC